MQKVKQLWDKLPPIAKKAIHTFWQTFAVVFLAGLTNLLSVFAHGGLAAAQAALLSLVLAAGAAALSALKTFAINYFGSN